MTDERSDDGAQHVPEDPQADPEQAVDAMEERVLGHSVDSSRDDVDDAAPAFEQDLDPEDQGTAEAGAEQSG